MQNTYTKSINTDANPLTICKALLFTLAISNTTGGTTDPAPGSETYNEGTKVTITAKPESGYRFSEWSGDVSAKRNPIIVKMDSDKSIKANFLKDKPTAPKDLEAEALSWNKIRLKWKDESNNEDGFKIFRRIGKEGRWKRIAVTKANVKTYLDKGLEESTFHRYRVRAFNSKGHSAYSNQAGAKTKKKI